jgi:hypothetical protein
MLEIAVAVLTSIMGPEQPEEPRLVVRNTPCGFGVGAPATWRVRRVESARRGECEIHLVPPATDRIAEWCGKSVDCFAIRVRARVGDARTACEQYGVCTNERGSWYFAGPSGGGVPARARRTGCCLVIEGNREIHVYNEDGVRATADALDAMLIGSNRIAEIDANTGEGYGVPRRRALFCYRAVVSVSVERRRPTRG